MTEPARLTACIVAFNEQDRIEECVRSVDFCDEVLVVDSHSEDRTRELAAALGARVIERDWPGYVEQKRFAMGEARHDWILSVDADERISSELRAEIEELRRSGFAAARGWWMPRTTAYLGRWIRHGAWHPDLQLRLFDRRHARWGGTNPHDKVLLDGTPGRLRGTLWHYSYRSFQGHLDTIDRFTAIAAEGLQERGRRARLIDVVVRPWGYFLRSLILKRGFLDGWRGVLIAYLGAHYVRLKYARLMARQRGAPDPELPE